MQREGGGGGIWMRDEKKGGLTRGKRKGECFPYVGVEGSQRMCVLLPHLSMTRLTKKGRQWTARAAMIATYSRRRNQTTKQVSGKVSRNQITDIPNQRRSRESWVDERKSKTLNPSCRVPRPRVGSLVRRGRRSADHRTRVNVVTVSAAKPRGGAVVLRRAPWQK